MRLRDLHLHFTQPQFTWLLLSEIMMEGPVCEGGQINLPL